VSDRGANTCTPGEYRVVLNVCGTYERHAIYRDIREAEKGLRLREAWLYNLRRAIRVRQLWHIIVVCEQFRIHIRRDTSLGASASLPLPQAEQYLSGTPHGSESRSALGHWPERLRIRLVFPVRERVCLRRSKWRRIKWRYRH